MRFVEFALVSDAGAGLNGVERLKASAIGLPITCDVLM